MTRFVPLDAQAFEKPQRRTRGSYLPEYREFLSEIGVGAGGELILDGDDKKATIKNRINHAARLEEKKLRFLRTAVDRVRFQVIEPAEQLQSLPEELKEAPAPEPAKPKGRSRKAS